MAVDLWDDADKAPAKAPAPKRPGPGPKQEQAAEPVWSVPVTFEGKSIDNFPLSYVLQQNNPWVYLEVLKVYGIVPPSWTPEQATTATDTQPSLVKRFTDALDKAVDTVLVPKNKQYANAKVILDNMVMKLHQLVHKTPGTEGAGDAGDSKDFMEVVAEEHPEVMSQVAPNTPAWNAIRGAILKEHNQHGTTGGIIADAQGRAGPMQQRNIRARGVQIRATIINVMRGLGMFK